MFIIKDNEKSKIINTLNFLKENSTYARSIILEIENKKSHIIFLKLSNTSSIFKDKQFLNDERFETEINNNGFNKEYSNLSESRKMNVIGVLEWNCDERILVRNSKPERDKYLSGHNCIGISHTYTNKFYEILGKIIPSKYLLSEIEHNSQGYLIPEVVFFHELGHAIQRASDMYGYYRDNRFLGLNNEQHCVDSFELPLVIDLNKRGIETGARFLYGHNI